MSHVESSAISPGIVTIPVGTFALMGGISPAFRALERAIADIAPTDVPILLTGESGAGKDIIALEIHRQSRNSLGPFVKCNCAVLGAESLRNYLIGANIDQHTTGTGTLFLDDVGRLEVASQNLLLQFLSEGGTSSQSSSFHDRVISSTTGNLEQEAYGGRFREELYYRISGISLHVPPLRQRREDLPLLLDHFLKKYASSFDRPEPRLSSGGMDFLLRHSWPGNVRELENLARKFVIFGDEELVLSDLAASRGSFQNLPQAGCGSTGRRLSNGGRSLKAAAREASRNVERELILSSLERTHWNRKRTARELQISYKALLYKLKQLEIDGAIDLAQELTQAPH